MPSVKPALRAALVSQLSIAAPAPLEVRYGYGFTDTQEGTALMVGAVDPFAEGDQQTIDSSTQEWVGTGNGGRRDETGDIQCVVMAWNGNPGQEGVQDAYETAYANAAWVEAYLKANPTVGDVLGLLWAEYGTESEAREFDDNGPVCLIQFSVHFRARF